MPGTLTPALSVAVNALTGEKSGLSILSRAMRPLRAPLQGLISLVRVTTNTSPLGRMLNALVFAICGGSMGLAIAGTDVPNAVFVPSALLFGVVMVMALFRNRMWKLG